VYYPISKFLRAFIVGLLKTVVIPLLLLDAALSVLLTSASENEKQVL
jgi:hypothetical protein